jgi:hypothetical protein
LLTIYSDPVVDSSVGAEGVSSAVIDLGLKVSGEAQHPVRAAASDQPDVYRRDGSFHPDCRNLAVQPDPHSARGLNHGRVVSLRTLRGTADQFAVQFSGAEHGGAEIFDAPKRHLLVLVGDRG